MNWRLGGQQASGHMRDFKGMKRQRGRSRNGSGKPQQQNANRAFESNGPDNVKVRGAAQSVFEKYQQLARDATSSGDRVLAENYLQHAEHYFRVLRLIQPNRAVAEIVGRDQLASGFDMDFEAEPEEQEISEDPQPSENEGDGRQDRQERQDRFRDERPRDGYRDRDDRPREDRNRDDRNRDDRSREDRSRDDRPRDERPRDERPRDDRARDDRPRDDRPRDDRPRDDRPREDRQRAEGGRRDRWRDRDDRGPRPDRNGDRDNRGPLAIVDPQALSAGPSEVTSPPEAPRLRGEDGMVSEMPAFLSRPAVVAAEAPITSEPEGEEPVRKPRRRRVTKAAEPEVTSDEG
jgi:hypothetical protein